MDSCYHIEQTDRIISPALIVYRDLVRRNLDHMLQIAGDPARLRPHCKTHKMADVVRLQLALGITKHKCATVAEAEMLAEAGVPDIFLAYNIVGPNVERVVRFRATYPDVTFSVSADDAAAVQTLARAMRSSGQTVSVLLDLDVGQHRTGVAIGDQGRDLYRQLVETPGVEPGGLHAYDGHNHQVSRDHRAAVAKAIWNEVVAFRDTLLAEGWPVPRINACGTGSFPMFAKLDDPSLELNPGTCVFHDAGYRDKFPDLDFTPAALLLTRVVSRPTARRVTLDLGNKAVASDPPAGRRVVLPEIPDARQVCHNEEHLVIETSHAEYFRPGDAVLAIPWHVCPTSALHKQAYVIVDGKLAGTWTVTARDRSLTI